MARSGGAQWLSSPLLALLLLLPLLPAAAFAQVPAIEIAPAGAAIESAAPRAVTTVALRVSNHASAGEFAAVLTLPPGWRTMTPDAPFTLAAGASTVRLISVFVPETAAAGAHRLEYALSRRGAQAVQGSYSWTLQVATSVKLAVSLLDMPDMVVAGEPYSGSFLLHNRGNAAITVDYKAHSSRGYRLDAAAGDVTLPPGATRTVRFGVATAAVPALERDWLVLVAQARGASAVERATGVVKLIPRISEAAQRYNTIPVNATVRAVGTKEGGKSSTTAQVELSGTGRLAGVAGGQGYLDFLLRGPGARSASTFGQQDEYRVAYHDERLAVGLGDLNFALTPLTESGRYGRGASASYVAGALLLRGYAMTDPRAGRVVRPSAEELGITDPARLDEWRRLYPDSAISEQALSVGLAYSDSSRVDLNVMRKRDSDCRSGASIVSVRDQTQRSGLTAALEVASSNCAGVAGKALRLDYAERDYRLKWNTIFIRADASYGGSNPDQQLAVFTADYPLTGALSLHANYRSQQNNLGQVATRAAFDERQAGAGASYQYRPNAQADLDVIVRDTGDRRAQPSFDASHHALRLSARQRYRDLSLYASALLGSTTDRLHDDTFAARQLSASAYWSARRDVSLGVYVLAVDNAYSTIRDKPQQSLGASLRYALSESTLLDASLQGNRGGSAIDLALSHRRPNGDVLTLALRRNQVPTAQRSEFVLSYTMPLALPVSRRGDVASVSGRVHDDASGAGVAGLLLRLGGVVAVSDANGAFLFPAIAVGSHYLSMEETAGPAGRIALEPMPMAVQVQRGADPHIDIALVRAATLHGAVSLASGADDASGAADAVLAVDGLRGLLVTFQRGPLAYKRLTDAQGQFRLGRVAPGPWTVSVDSESLPAGFELEGGARLLELPPGGEAALTFRLRPKSRNIKMQQLPPVRQ